MTSGTATLIGCGALFLGGPVGLILVANLIRQRDFGQRSLRLLVVGGIVASGAIILCAAPAFHRLFPPPHDPVFASGRGLDLRGIWFWLAAWAGGALTFALALAYGVDLGRLRRSRQSERQTNAPG
ncbi:hypothetical protein C7C45_07790 [Micromonospora arborensis]|uniref:Uncharacterized protein n=1 Tax=Micromonospora arborensis TaxID=2116518 RepID=A0A318NRF1_9ACTN|nr:hypothetical protein [Micromonospora arborensis]PYC72991.1 hypothetical protein C7C45_07790 [Micromonospora arborensis]